MHETLDRAHAALEDALNAPAMKLVWRISPDPNGAFDNLIVGSAEQAGEIATEAARMALEDDHEPRAFAIDCAYMSQAEFDALPEP